MSHSKEPQALCVLITRVPKPGQAKTRLIPALGNQGAADLQRDLSSHVAKMMQHAAVLCSQPEYDSSKTLRVKLQARVVGGTVDDARAWLGMKCLDQGEGDLGNRMERAINEGFASGADVVAVLGGDCPELDGARIRSALVAAQKNGAALIPARDGGYCLLALRRDAVQNVDNLFEKMTWSTGEVCARQIERLQAQGVEPYVLEVCADIDEPEDLPRWYEIKRKWYGAIKSLSVIIPTYNEAQNLPRCLEAARSYFSQRNLDVSIEFIVVDGASSDETSCIAQSLGCTVIQSERGRATQMNAGARASLSDALLFLHADTLLRMSDVQEKPETLVDLLNNPHRAVGAFTFAFDKTGCSLREEILAALYERNTRKRVQRFANPYGDQALFCRRATFQSLGGWGTPPLMEDILFVDRARAVGEVGSLADVALTSTRRYREYGFIKTMMANRRAAYALYRGVPLADIAQAYQARFKRSGS